MKKKIILMVSALVCMLALCSCSKDTAETDYNGYSSGDLQSACEQTAEVLEGLTAQEAVQYYEYYASAEDGEAYADLIEQWIEIEPEIGDFVGFKDFEVTKSGKTLSATETIAFTERDITLTYVFNANTMEVTAVNVQIVYSLGETMQKAGLNTLMGISVVFCILVLISLIIYCFNLIPVLQKKFSKKQDDEARPVKAPAPVAAPIAKQQDDLELIAVIAAAIAMETGASTDDFVVRSIKRRY
jgi:sodium pump decarboxylase gamma subunit